QLFGDFGENFVRVKRGDSVAGDEIQQAEVARLGALFVEEPGVLDGDTGFAGENTEQFEMAFVEGFFLVGKDAQGGDRAVVGNQGDAAERARGANRFNAELADLSWVIFADENGLTGAQDVFRDVIAGGTGTLGHAYAANHFQLKFHDVADGVEGSE